MIPGFNHNIQYKEQIFHIQTEDSGVQNPHVITHLFYGGNIVDSRKMSYADIVKSDKLDEVIVELMQMQHKQMLKDLVNGFFDDKILQRVTNAAHLDGPAPLNVDRGQNRTSMMFGSMGQSKSGDKQKPAASAPKETTPASAQAAVAKPQKPEAPAAPVAPATQTPEEAPVAQAKPVAPKESFSPMGGGAEPPSIFSAPAPASSAQESPAVEDEDESGEKVINADSLQKAFASDNKAAINSIFGEDLISEKSLDEVILSYLAEDVK